LTQAVRTRFLRGVIETSDCMLGGGDGALRFLFNARGTPPITLLPELTPSVASRPWDSMNPPSMSWSSWPSSHLSLRTFGQDHDASKQLPCPTIAGTTRSEEIVTSVRQ
jgi:hypothetical protein